MRQLLLSLLLFCAACPGEPVCGNNKEEAGEACDDGNNLNADGCEADCTLPACGNGIVDPGEVCLTEAQVLTTDSVPKEAIIDDFDGDGVLDLAVATSGGRAVDVFLGLGGGEFAAQPIVTSLSDFGASLVAGNFNGDGVPDLAVLLSDADAIATFLGQGDGSFIAGAALATAQNPSNLISGDFDGDGNLDLATGADNPGTLHLFSGRGDGTFADNSLTLLDNPAGLASGDLNGDGKLDLVATFPDQNALLPLTRGVSSFELRPIVAVGENPISATMVDLNSDGKLDLAVGHLGEVRTLLGDGTGSFAAAQVIATEGANFFLDSGDVNSDGRPDVATVTSVPSELNLLISQESGELASFSLPLSVEGAFMVRFAELNGDSTIDAVVTADAAARVVVFFSNP
jgi:cysteine-rich repeat protein